MFGVLDNSISTSSCQGTTICSGNVKCSSTTTTNCICNAGYSLDDCSLKKTEFESAITSKIKLLEKAEENYKIKGDFNVLALLFQL
jgi:hypothetical protein